jgi:hypothetical protein
MVRQAHHPAGYRMAMSNRQTHDIFVKRENGVLRRDFNMAAHYSHAGF